MNIDRREVYRDLLQRKIAELASYQLKTISEMTISNERFTEIIDQTSVEADRSFELRIRDRERRLIAKIKEALERIDEGTYGICDECSEEIPEKRLIARPMTTLCITCKTAQEKNDKLLGKWDRQAMEYAYPGSVSSQQYDYY